MELEAENVKNIRNLALCKELLRQAHPSAKLIRLSKWMVSSRKLCKFILNNCPFIEK